MARKPPAKFGPRGAAFYAAAQRDYELNIDETELLIEACRLLDRCDELHALVAADGLMVEGAAGQPRAHPALGELRGVQLTLSRLLAQVGLPDLRGKQLPTPERLRAVRAASVRWSGHEPAGGA